MKKQTFLSAILITFILTLSGCEVIGGIFKTGVGFGVIIAIVVVVIIIFVIRKMKRN
jgi:multisubunit Na+/H+ antiporter MnhB subunit